MFDRVLNTLLICPRKLHSPPCESPDGIDILVSVQSKIVGDRLSVIRKKM